MNTGRWWKEKRNPAPQPICLASHMSGVQHICRVLCVGTGWIRFPNGKHVLKLRYRLVDLILRQLVRPWWLLVSFGLAWLNVCPHVCVWYLSASSRFHHWKCFFKHIPAAFRLRGSDGRAVQKLQALLVLERSIQCIYRQKHHTNYLWLINGDVLQTYL